MLHSRAITLDSSGSEAAGTVSVPPARFAGLYYKFSDGSQDATIDVSCLGLTLFQKDGASNSDGLQQQVVNPEIDPPVDGQVVVALSGMTGAPAADVAITLLFDFGGNG